MPETKARFLADTQKADTTAEAFTWPTGRATSNNHVLAMTDISAGTTGWQVTSTAPAITGVSGELNVYESSSSTEDGGVLTLTGTDFGTQSEINSIKIMDSSEGNKVTASSFTVNSTTSITVTFAGTESGYNSWGTGGLASTVWYIQVTKSGLSSNVFNSGKSFTKDPTIASVTQTASGDNNGTLTFDGTGGVFGSYGGQTAGGGQDSNTKLLLNFDRTGGTDIEDSSNVGGNGHKVTATNAVIKASPFGDGKSAIDYGTRFVVAEGSGNDDFTFGANSFTFEFWLYLGDISTGHQSIFAIDRTDDEFRLEFDGSDGGMELWVKDTDIINGSLDGEWNAKQWYHIAITRSVNTFTFYKDGVNVKSATNASSLVNAGNEIVFGHVVDQGGGVSAGTMIDEIRIVKGTNTTNGAVYTGDFTVPTSRLTAITNTKLLIHSDRSGGLGVGNRNGNITVTNTSNLVPSTFTGTYQQLVDGDTTSTGSAYPWFDAGESTGHLLFDFKIAEIVNKFTWIQGNSTSQGQWTFSGSNDNSSFTALKTNFDLVSASSSDHTFTNTTAYRYYKLEKTGTGTTSGNPYTHEIQFFNTAFTDSSSDSPANNTAHNITATGAFHSGGHGGIAPALTFPASGKLTGSAGVYLDGNDYLRTNDYEAVNVGTGAFTFECWFYPTNVTPNYQRIWQYSNTTPSDDEMNIGIHQGNLIYRNGNTSWTTTSFPISNNQWYHLALVRTSTGSNDTKIYINGKYTGIQYTDNSNFAITAGDIELGNSFYGYIDLVRFSNVARYHGEQTSGDWSNYLGTSGTTAWDQPTKIYGALGPENPSIGSIEITTATDDDVNVTYSFQGSTEDNANVLGSSSDLAIASDTSGANKKKGTLTGTLQGNAGSVTNLRIQAKANNDAKRLVEVNETTGVGAIRLDKLNSGIPVLFNARRYVGTTAISNAEITGYGFAPDLIWTKKRSAAEDHGLFDRVRGNNSRLFSSTNGTGASTGGITFGKDGFTTSAGYGTDSENDATYIAWAWKAGGAPVSITSGVTALTDVTQSASSTSGFSITKYTGGAGATNATSAIPHNLGGTPDFIIVKNLSGAYDWVVYHKDLTTDKNVNLNNNTAEDTKVRGYIDAPDSTNINLHASTDSTYYGRAVNRSGDNFICYAWKAVTGVSAFGKMIITTDASTRTETGLGFSPRFVLVKNVASGDWVIFDTFRDTASPITKYLSPNEDADEGEYGEVKCTMGNDGFTLGSFFDSKTLIYIAFA